MKTLKGLIPEFRIDIDISFSLPPAFYIRVGNTILTSVKFVRALEADVVPQDAVGNSRLRGAVVIYSAAPAGFVGKKGVVDYRCITVTTVNPPSASQLGVIIHKQIIMQIDRAPVDADSAAIPVI